MQVTAVVAVVLCALAATVSSAQVLSITESGLHVCCRLPRCSAGAASTARQIQTDRGGLLHCRLRI